MVLLLLREVRVYSIPRYAVVELHRNRNRNRKEDRIKNRIIPVCGFNLRFFAVQLPVCGFQIIVILTATATATAKSTAMYNRNRKQNRIENRKPAYPTVRQGKPQKQKYVSFCIRLKIALFFAWEEKYYPVNFFSPLQKTEKLKTLKKCLRKTLKHLLDGFQTIFYLKN